MLVLLLSACTDDEGRPPPPPGDGPDLREEVLADTVLGRRLRVVGGLDAPTEVVCEAPGIDGERHRLVASPEAPAVTFRGLLAETTYDCAIDGGDPVSFRTAPLPAWLPSAHLEEQDPARQPRGYLLMNHGTDIKEDRQTKVLVWDDEGRLRWYHDPEGDAADLDVQYLPPASGGDGQLVYGGGYGIVPTRVDLSGRVLARAPGPFQGADELYNHHVEQLADGTVLTTETATVSDPANPARRFRGFVIERLSHDLQERIWHFESQDWMDDGSLPVPADRFDAFHLNALQPLPDGRILASLYALRRVVILDPETGAMDESVGYDTGWRLEDADGDPLPTAEWFWGQHAPELDGDLLLVHDNGAARPVPPGANFTRALELRLDWDARVATQVWQYRQEGWLENIWGDVDRLDGGLVSITHAHCEKCQPDRGERTEVIVVDRADDAVVWRLVYDDPQDASYRSSWIDGCAIFARECGL